MNQNNKTMKLISWNVNGVRAAVKKDFINQMAELNPDVMCLQETKAQDDQVQEALQELKGYHIYSKRCIIRGNRRSIGSRSTHQYRQPVHFRAIWQ